MMGSFLEMWLPQQSKNMLNLVYRFELFFELLSEQYIKQIETICDGFFLFNNT